MHCGCRIRAKARKSKEKDNSEIDFLFQELSLGALHMRTVVSSMCGLTNHVYRDH